jgi:hypothetical protein
VAAGFGGAGATVLGAGALGAFFSPGGVGPHDYFSEVDWDFDSTQLSGHLLVGLLDHASFGVGFQKLEFVITEDGTVLVDQLFTDSLAAASFFDDHLIDLGTFALGTDLQLTFSFALTADSLGSGFGMDFIFGAAANGIIPPPGGGGGETPVPAPGTLTLFGVACIVLLVVRRRVRSGT